MAYKFVVQGEPRGKENMKPIKMGNHLSLCNTKNNNNYMALIQDHIALKLNQRYNIDNYPVYKKDQPLYLTIAAYFKLQSNCYKKDGSLNKEGLAKIGNKIRPTKKPDCDNISKIVCDSLNGLMFHDDSQIVKLVVYKFYSNNPRISISIGELGKGDENEDESIYNG